MSQITKAPFVVHWFRRDLRVIGNELLETSSQRFNGRVVGFFCFDSQFLAREDFSHRRFQFFLHTLVELKKQLQEMGSDLWVIDKRPEAAFSFLLSSLKKHDIDIPSQIQWNRDYEPFARTRDEHMSQWFKQRNIQTLTERDHLLFEPDELVKSDGTAYQVYTPYSKAFIKLMDTDIGLQRIAYAKKQVQRLQNAKGQKKVKQMFSLTWQRLVGQETYEKHEALDSFVKHNTPRVSIAIPQAGAFAAYDALTAFETKLNSYRKHRDIPAFSGTSHMSYYLKNGSMTVPMIVGLLGLKPFDPKNKTSRDTYLGELIWREFYVHLLYRHPRIEHEAFLLTYAKLDWQNNEVYFDKWKQGLTGYPMVDAGMRELKETGFMHNRVRMIVASFLTKHLQVNWQWGEQYFMQMLLDGDLAANNGGWQWCASTGCDAQPYFRVFNPWLQSKKFDPDGSYIRRFVPELNDVETKNLHKPILGHKTYPKPIVEHTQARQKALALYKKARAIKS